MSASILNTIDHTITKWIYDNIGRNKNPLISKAPYYLGLLPYELYVLPGMFLAIFVMFYDKTFHPVQFHLLPHWFAYSMATYIKHNVDRIRPGCIKENEMNKLIDPKHCIGGTKHQSFPSGHTIIAVALATTLRMYLLDDTYKAEDKTFLGIPFYDPMIQTATICFGFFVAFMISIHRMSYGYHNFSDVLVGALLGYAIGFSIYLISNLFKMDADEKIKEEKKEEENGTTKEWHGIQIAGMVLSGIAFMHFFVYRFNDLAKIQH